jgi:hypothetical protein
MAKESPPPPKKIPTPPRVSTIFKIRLLGAMSAGDVILLENCTFQIVDKKNNLTCFYMYSGLGFGVSAFPVSATMKGPWNDFTTSSAVRVSQFGGAARFTTAGAAGKTLNYLNMMGLPEDVSTVPVVLGIQTGFTVGIGDSTTVGRMLLKPREEMTYTGD